MVLPAILRHPAIGPEQIAGRDRTIRFDRRAGLPAVARYVAHQAGAVPAPVCEILLAVCDRLHWPGLARHQAAERDLSDLGARTDLLLLCILPGCPPGAWTL